MEAKFAGVGKIRSTMSGGAARSGEGRFIDAVQQPNFSKACIGTDDPIENKQNIRDRNVKQFTCEMTEFARCIGFCSVPQRIIVGTCLGIDVAHGSQIPEVASAIPIFDAAHGIPETSGIHPLSSIIGGIYDIVRPEESLVRVINQNGIVRHGATVIVQIMRAFGIRIIGAAIDSQISAVINRKVVLR